MVPLKDNQDVACFLVTKHSWKGKYKRIFSVGSMGITTYNPTTLDVTNKWMYSDFISVLPTVKVVGQQNNEFIITMKKEKKVDSMRFSTEHRAQLLTEALRFRNLFAEKPKETLRYHAYKHHWSDTRLPIMLEVTACSLDQLDPSTGAFLASYYYKDIEGMADVKDYPGGFVIVCGGFGRMHLFASAKTSEIRQKMFEAASCYVGISIKVLKEPITEEEFSNQRLGKFSALRDDTISRSRQLMQQLELRRAGVVTCPEDVLPPLPSPGRRRAGRV
ncbi:hypothetical protein PR048_017792 [Dryococelus australis]|uniref:DnaJ homologue subfamily C GRV2/DNAJC13 N-terminal domain-containing protein n=1 Tax=Dryococelus australis TaxID=614101 RepID=A0ABQ9HAH1_9NEOP|nr:hypothetical protein PR048_017792 [Dryococelus australis]